MAIAAPRPLSRTSFLASIVLAAIAIASVFVFPERDEGLGVLIWITALIPAFLLAYFRGLVRAAILIAGSMAAIAIIQAMAVAGESSDTLPPARPAIYGAVLLGMIVLVEMLHRERRAAGEVALVDRITGLPSREYFDLAIQQEFAAAERGRGMAVVMFDVDNLATVNSRFGRPAGDVAVNTLAKVVAANTRKENLSAHFGNGRFVSVLREGDAKGAAIFAQRVLDQLRESAFPWGGRVTASAGVAEYESGMGTHELLVGAADRAVGRAKSGGRDMVAFAPDKAEREDMARHAAEAARGGAVLESARRLVYLVDDDASVRSALRGMLVRAGYDVWDSGDPPAAIARYRDASPGERPAAVIADVIMPAMTGTRMMAEIAEANPDVRVVYISAYAQSDITWRDAPGGAVAMLAKPFTSEQMMDALAQVTAPPG